MNTEPTELVVHPVEAPISTDCVGLAPEKAELTPMAIVSQAVVDPPKELKPMLTLQAPVVMASPEFCAMNTLLIPVLTLAPAEMPTAKLPFPAAA
jgi:hypothetical protein